MSILLTKKNVSVMNNKSSSSIIMGEVVEFTDCITYLRSFTSPDKLVAAKISSSTRKAILDFANFRLSITGQIYWVAVCFILLYDR